MEGSEKWLSPSKSSHKPSSTGPGENNENEDKLIHKFQNQKKTVAKHFMSPTISAASKAAPPRKKILSERNENSSNSDAQHHKTSNLDKKTSPRNLSNDRPSARIASSYDHASEPDNDDFDADFSDDSSLKGYDPLTNYLSPRPQYLRFNPNRRREIFSRLEKEELNDSFDSQEVGDDEIKGSPFSPQKESVVKPENEGSSEEKDEKNICDDYDDDEEEEDEEDVEEESGLCLKGVLKLVLTLIACVSLTSYICTMNSPTPTPTRQAISSFKDGCLMIKRQTLEVIGTKMYEAGSSKVEVGDDYDEAEEVDFDEHNDDGEIEESVEEEIFADDVENLEEAQEDRNGETEESSEAKIVKDDVRNLEKVDDELAVENDNEVSEGKSDKKEEIEGERVGELESKDERFDQLTDAKTEESIDAGSFSSENDVETEIESETDSYGQLISAKTDKIENSIHDVEEMEVVEKEKMGSSVIGVSVILSVILTSLAVIIYRLTKPKCTRVVVEESEPVLKPHKLTVEEKKKVEFFARPSSLHHSIEEEASRNLDHIEVEASRKLDRHINAPTVELIGEIVIGPASSRRIRKYEAEFEEKNATSITKNATTTQPVSVPNKPSVLENSTVSSPSSSYGSFATEKKILKKEGGQKSGESSIGATPVRRSSRLRNRAAVTSP